MRHALKASFIQQSDAQHLLDELTTAGYSHARLALASTTHPELLTREQYAVTLTVGTDEDMIKASDIMDRCQAVRIEDVKDAPEGSEPDDVNALFVDQGVHTFPPGAEPGALQFHHLDDAHYYGTQNPEAPPSGMTFQDTMGTAEYWTGAEEFTIRPHSSAPSTTMDSGVDNSASLVSADGNGSVNSTVTEDRAARPSHYALSAWNKVKAAFRHGWDRAHS